MFRRTRLNTVINIVAPDDVAPSETRTEASAL